MLPFSNSGSQDGFIHHHDVRVQNHHVSTLSGHSQVSFNCDMPFSFFFFPAFVVGLCMMQQFQMIATIIFLLYTQEVCGLEWSKDGKYLASGGNDNIVNVYNEMETKPLYSFTDHQSAVKVGLLFHRSIKFYLQTFIVLFYFYSRLQHGVHGRRIYLRPEVVAPIDTFGSGIVTAAFVLRLLTQNRK